MNSLESVAIPKQQVLTEKLFERITEPAEWIKFLNATSKLSDRDFELAVHDSGFRVITLVQRQGAFKGNKRLVDACEIYLKRAKECLSQADKRTVQDDSKPSPSYKPRDPQ